MFGNTASRHALTKFNVFILTSNEGRTRLKITTMTDSELGLELEWGIQGVPDLWNFITIIMFKYDEFRVKIQFFEEILSPCLRRSEDPLSATLI